jgi:hypothetical protein
MAFMLCGEGPQNKTRKKRAAIVTGIEPVVFVERPPVTVINPRPDIYQDAEEKGREAADHVEGMDYIVYQVVKVSENKETQQTTVYSEGKLVELKSIANYLNRDDHNGLLPNLLTRNGTIYFELYNKKGNAPGWLHHFYHPDRPDAINPATKKQAVTKRIYELVTYPDHNTPPDIRPTTYFEPHYLVFLIFADTEGKYPIATISLEWDKIKDKLNSKAQGLFYPEWRMPKSAKEAMQLEQFKGWTVKGEGCGYCWHVPIEEFWREARITMIGTACTRLFERAIKESSNGKFYNIDRMWERYNYLKDHSYGGFIDYTFPPDPEEDDETY